MIKRKTILVILAILFIPHKCRMVEPIEDENEIVVVDEVIPDIVTLTTYSITENQTDSTPLITASGFKLDSINPKKHRVIAISRDLKRKYKFGQKVKIENAGKYNGVYVVRDLMHQRWTKKIDILINPSDKHTKIGKVKMYKVKKRKE